MAGELERLEAWKGGHKARSVSVAIGDNCGATCWTVDLNFEQVRGVNRVWASQASLMGDGDDDRPGLAATIAAALDRFDALKTKGGGV